MYQINCFEVLREVFENFTIRAISSYSFRFGVDARLLYRTNKESDEDLFRGITIR